MRAFRFKLFSAVALSASLVFTATAWSRPVPALSRHSVRAGSSMQQSADGQRRDLLGWIMAWWNSGSCHGYPDVMQVYQLYGDPETGDITSWTMDGQTSGYDTCSNPHGSPWSDGPMWDGYVQGEYNGTTTWNPDDGICDGCMQLAGRNVVRNANELFINARLSAAGRRSAPWQSKTFGLPIWSGDEVMPSAR